MLNARPAGHPRPTAPARSSSQPSAPSQPSAATVNTPTLVPSLAALTTADLGDGTWKLIATETNEGGLGRTEILGFVDIDFGWAFTCVGSGTATLTIAASGGSTPTDAIPYEIVNTTYNCPAGIQLDFGNTAQHDGGTVSLSPNVDPSQGVGYRLIVGTMVR